MSSGKQETARSAAVSPPEHESNPDERTLIGLFCDALAPTLLRVLSTESKLRAGFDKQRLARHFRWNRQSHDVRHRRRHIGEATFGSRRPQGIVDDNERHRIGGVGGVRLSGVRIDHLLAVAMVGGGDKDGSADFWHVADSTQASINGLDGRYRRR